LQSQSPKTELEELQFDQKKAILKQSIHILNNQSVKTSMVHIPNIVLSSL